MDVRESLSPKTFYPQKFVPAKYTILPLLTIHSSHTESHKWQLRAYVFSGKNIYTADDDSVCDPYAVVSFHNQTQQTLPCKKTLCPEWDQTLIFEDIVMYGQPSQCADNSPYVCVSLYDKHRIVSLKHIFVFILFQIFLLERRAKEFGQILSNSRATAQPRIGLFL